MHNIISLDRVDRPTIRDLAHAAADRGESLINANPFEPGCGNHLHFEHDFLARERLMTDLVTS